MPRYGRIGAGLAALALLTGLVGAAPATAAPTTSLASAVLTYPTVAGTAVSVGDVIQASLRSGTNATFYSSTSGTTGIKCAASSFSAKVLTNPTAPGTATESLTAQSFSSCTTNVFGTTGVQSVTVNNLPYTTSVTSAGVVKISGTTAAPIQSTVVLNSLLGAITCVYRTSTNTLTGTASNGTNSISFTNQVLTKFSGPSLCFGTAYFTASYSPVKDTSKTGSPAVYVN
ncbi:MULTISPECIES: Tat pathway signal sequence domain protein [unclassified Micromonospora]|uniref:Tat pathway signal sequence domain protein n=1 Tax=unclassified Micromonospora TaxID=2617518 RepID=UPI00188FF3A3|nr:MULTISPECIES: Tat pathway signal sequence domain protein [unclassified Micromonospora]MBF5033483.1 Tat pathway signal sequence domain protein [Micromonospora sp. ANENR4]MCZ7476353.1 Tat pathway signal sequence domain protein [Micromonospora sp. WMMC273]WBC01191.1 Tat pathway signal sequence domain protein [Micromonospora sp. WMMA1976]